MVTDNAAACKAAGKIIEAAYPHITWSPCVAHVCDLALEDIFNLPYFREVHTNTKAFVSFINNHHATLAAWRELGIAGLDTSTLTPEQVAEALKSSKLALLRPGETRFASAFLMLERSAECRVKLQQFVVSDAWNTAVGSMKAADRVSGLGMAMLMLCCICM